MSRREFDAYFLSSQSHRAEGKAVLESMLRSEVNIGFDQERRTQRACARCRRLKQRCDSERPCKACIRRGCAGTCVDWDRGRALVNKLETSPQSTLCRTGSIVVQRPIAWHQAVARVEKSSSGAPAAAIPPLTSNSNFLQGVLRIFGVNKAAQDDILAAIPSELCDAIVEMVRVVSQPTPFARKLLEGRHWKRKNQMSPQDEQTRLNQLPTVGYVKCTFDTASHGVSWDFQLNYSYCRMLCMHPEEVLARTQQDEMELPFPRLDMLCFIVDSLDVSSMPVSRSSVVDRTRFHVMLRRDPGAAPLLCRSDCRLTFDARGNLASNETFVQPISAEQYDTHRRLSPHLCRPFSSALGAACCGGTELLSRCHCELGLSLSALGKTAEGQQAFRSLAAQIRDCTARCREVMAAMHGRDQARALDALQHETPGASRHCGAESEVVSTESRTEKSSCEPLHPDRTGVAFEDAGGFLRECTPGPSEGVREEARENGTESEGEGEEPEQRVTAVGAAGCCLSDIALTTQHDAETGSAHSDSRKADAESTTQAAALFSEEREDTLLDPEGWPGERGGVLDLDGAGWGLWGEGLWADVWNASEAGLLDASEQDETQRDASTPSVAVFGEPGGSRSAAEEQVRRGGEEGSVWWEGV